MITLRKLSVLALIIAGLLIGSSLQAATPRVSDADAVVVLDLDAYVQSMTEEDPNVSKVDFGEDKISLWYKQPAKLFGFLPMSIAAKTVVNADGSVEIKYPWYKGLMSTSADSELKASIEASVGNIFQSQGDDVFSDNTKARLIGAVRALMKNNLGAKAKASVRAEAN